MSGVLLLDHQDTAASLDAAPLMDAVGVALVAISRGDVSAPPRVAARAPSGLLGAMPAHVPGMGLAAKLVSVFAHAGRGGGSSHRGIVALFDEDDGRLLALVDGEVVTARRTAAAATVAMQSLAKPAVGRIAVLGTGTQARAQLDLLAAVAIGGDVTVGGRHPARASELAARYPGATASNIRSAVASADVVFCCTSAREPVLRRTWIASGAHVSSVGGSDGSELDRSTVLDASLFVEWRGAVSEPPPAGAHELQGLDPDRAALVGAVLDGRHPGRSGPDELTLFKSTGHAALDVAAARVAYDLARSRGIGRTATW